MRFLEGRDFLPDTDQPDINWLDRYIHPDDQDTVWRDIQQAIRTKQMFEMEHRVLRVDGSVGWTILKAVPLLNDDGEIIEWLGTVSDITERKKGKTDNES
jgi:PAS domain S-box-containing protein